MHIHVHTNACNILSLKYGTLLVVLYVFNAFIITSSYPEVRSIVPMMSLTWNLARTLKVTDPNMIQQIR